MIVKKNVLIAGASGMIGGHLLQCCIESPLVDNITLLVRKPISHSSSKIKQLVVENLTDYSRYNVQLQHIDVVYFCIGVYTGAVDRATFSTITIDYPVALGLAMRRQSPKAKFVLLSGAGADRTEKSKMMFAKDKGIAENRLFEIFGADFHSARPGYIYPVVKRQEPNISYSIMRLLYPLIRIFGKKYSIPSDQLAEAIFRLGINGAHQTVFENDELLQLLKNQ